MKYHKIPCFCCLHEFIRKLTVNKKMMIRWASRVNKDAGISRVCKEICNSHKFNSCDTQKVIHNAKFLRRSNWLSVFWKCTFTHSGNNWGPWSRNKNGQEKVYFHVMLVVSGNRNVKNYPLNKAQTGFIFTDGIW